LRSNGVNAIFLFIRRVPCADNGGTEFGAEWARKRKGRVAFGRFMSPSAVYADDWARTIHLGVFGHHLALLMVLIFGMGARANGADDGVLRTWAACRFVAEHPASVTLGNQQARLVLTGAGGLMTKQEWRVSHDVLKTRTVWIKESNRDGAMTGVGVSGRQPVWFPQENEVLETCVTSKLRVEIRSRGKRSTKQLVHGGNRVQNNAGITARGDNGVVWSEDAREGGVEAENLVQRGVAIKGQHEVPGCLTGPSATDKLGLFGASVFDMLLDGSDVGCSITMVARRGRQIASPRIIDKSELGLGDRFGGRRGGGSRARCPVEEGSDRPILGDPEAKLRSKSGVEGANNLFPGEGIELWLRQEAMCSLGGGWREGGSRGQRGRGGSSGGDGSKRATMFTTHNRPTGTVSWWRGRVKV